MKIASKEPVPIKENKDGTFTTPGRTHEVNGVNYKFMPEKEGSLEGPMVCEVDDQDAIDVFLSKLNSNTFYAPDEKPSLKRARGAKAANGDGDAEEGK